MDDKWTKLTEEVEVLLEEMNQDPKVADAKLPPNLYEKIRQEISVREAAQAREKLSDEDKELLRLGRMYQKKHRMRKYLVLAAAVIAALALGITSVGGPEKIFETVNWMLGGRKQMNVDSDNENVVRPDDLAEEEAYEEIEDEFGFYPVRLNHLPDGIKYIEANIGVEVPKIYMLYGKDEEVNISYIIRPNYRESSWGKDIEDQLIEEYDMVVQDTRIQVRRYLVEGEEIRWLVGFEHDNTSYSMLLMHLEEREVEKIIANLYFS